MDCLGELEGTTEKNHVSDDENDMNQNTSVAYTAVDTTNLPPSAYLESS
jgi:hypothetical protein